jgi:hypothetical protein
VQEKSLVAITTTMLHNDLTYKLEAKCSQNIIISYRQK